MIYKSEIIKTNAITFKTRFCEDILFNMNATYYCNRLYFTNERYYTYRKENPNSLTEIFFSDKTLNTERNKAMLEMLHLSKTLYSRDLSPSQMETLKQSILKQSLLRFRSFYFQLVEEIFTKKLVHKDTKIAFWSAGKYFTNRLNPAKGIRFTNAVLVDNNPNLIGQRIFEYPIVSPKDLLKTQYAGYTHLLNPNYIYEFILQMREMGLISTFKELRLNIGENEQYDIQLQSMDELFDGISLCQSFDDNNSWNVICLTKIAKSNGS